MRPVTQKIAPMRFALPLLFALLAASAACAQTESVAPTEIVRLRPLPAPVPRHPQPIRNPSAYPNPNPNLHARTYSYPYPHTHTVAVVYPYPHAHPNSHAYATPAPLPPSTECLTEIDPDLVVPKPSPYPIYIPPPPAVPSSLEDLLNSSQVIVRGWVEGAEVRTDRVSPSRWDAELAGVTVDRLMPGCAATLQLRFNITEYLKGFGPHQILIEDNLGHRRNMPTVTLPYLTDGEARAAAWAWWNAQDGDPRRKESVLFIRELSPDGVARVSLRSSAVDPIVRHWVPLTDEISPSPAGQDAGAPRFYTESGPPGEGETPVVMQIEELRSRIAAFDALLAKGSGVGGYRECIETTIALEKLRRQYKVIYGPNYERTYTQRDQMPSGLPAGSGIYKYRSTGYSHYDNVWLDGPDHRHFKSEIVDDDDSAANGYYKTLTTARSLPVGTYRFFQHTQRREARHCDFTVNGYAISPYTNRWIVVVDPSVDGTLHEAFFDPTASDGSIGASAADGGLSPANFSVDGESNALEIAALASGAHRTGGLRPGGADRLRDGRHPHRRLGFSDARHVRRQVGRRGGRVDVGCAEPAVARGRPTHAPETRGLFPPLPRRDPGFPPCSTSPPRSERPTIPTIWAEE